MSKIKKVPMGSVVNLRTGKLDSNAAVEDGIYPFFTCDPNTLAINEYAFDEEAVLLAGNNASGNYTAKYYSGKFNAYQRTYVITPKSREELLTRYLLYALNQSLLYLKQLSAGTSTKYLTKPKLENLDIPLPPLSIQSKIVAVLSAYDRLIENNRKQIKLLEEAAQRLYKEWFIELRFPGHETTPINPETNLPEGWKTRQLSEIAELVFGQSPKSDFYNNIGEGLPFHQGVKGYSERFVVNEIYTSQWKREAKPGSILFSVRAPVGSINLTKERIAIGRGLASINSKNKAQSFLLYLLKEKFYQKDLMGNGSIYASINSETLKTIECVIPDSHLIELFEKLASRIDSEILTLDNEIYRLKEARDRLLPKLMSGEIEVS